MRFFADKYAASLNMETPIDIPPDVWKALRAYDFPGNVRELGSIINNAVSEMHYAKKRVMKPEHLGLADKKTKMAAVSSPLHNEIFENIILNYVNSKLEANCHLWKNKKSSDVPCLINISEFQQMIKKIVYETVGRNKAMAARILGISLKKFGNIK